MILYLMILSASEFMSMFLAAFVSSSHSMLSSEACFIFRSLFPIKWYNDRNSTRSCESKPKLMFAATASSSLCRRLFLSGISQYSEQFYNIQACSASARPTRPRRCSVTKLELMRSWWPEIWCYSPLNRQLHIPAGFRKQKLVLSTNWDEINQLRSKLPLFIIYLVNSSFNQLLTPTCSNVIVNWMWCNAPTELGKLYRTKTSFYRFS